MKTKYEFHSTYPPYFFGKTCVIIPCKNRAEHLRRSLHCWLSQTYRRFEIVLIDYNSDEPIYYVADSVAHQFGEEVDVEPEVSHRYEEYNRISLFRIEDVDQWNIAHALNYGIRNSSSDLVVVAGCDSLPDPRYLEFTTTLVSDSVIPSVWCGRVTFPRKYWYQINGYQEFCSGWGFEDLDFRGRLAQGTPADILEINRDLCVSIQHFDEEKKDYPSMYHNEAKCVAYFRKYGYIGNYGYLPGNLQPIEYKNEIEELILYVAYLNDYVPQNAHIATRCCYTGIIDNKTVFYLIPKQTDGLIFTEEIQNITENVKSVALNKTIWNIFDEINEGKLLDANF